MIWHMIIAYDLPLCKFNGLLNCMAVFFLGRPLEIDEFPSTPTIRIWMKRLTIIDRHRAHKIDLETFGFKSKFGFPVLYSIVSDGTVHGKNDVHHAMMRTATYPNGKERPQRWRVNGHFARRILEAFKIVN